MNDSEQAGTPLSAAERELLPRVPAVVVDRRRWIGGSDVAAILGISPWKTAVDLWAAKTAPEPDSRPATGVKRRGQRWESVVAEMLVERLEADGHKVVIVDTNRRLVDLEVPYFAAEIDFEILLDDDSEVTNVELKTVSPFKTGEWGESGSDDVPIWYTAQAMWGLGVTGRRKAIVAPLFGADEIRAFPIERDDVTIAAMRARAQSFWINHVLTGIPPEPTSLEDVAKIFPKDVEAAPIVADEELTGVLLRMRALDRELKARQAEFDSLQFMIERVMGSTTQVNIGDKAAVTWKERAWGGLDFERLKADHPKLYKEYSRKGVSRVFTLKNFSWKE